MSEKNTEKNKYTNIAKMPQERIATDQLGVDLADAAFLHDAGYPGVTEQELKQRWIDAKILGRNAVEEALGFSEPYGAGSFVDEASSRNNTTPGER